MSSDEPDMIYELLLKRYKDKGFLNPKIALDASIRDVMQKGRVTRYQAIRELNSSSSPWTYSPSPPLTYVEQEREIEQRVARARASKQIENLREKIDSLTTLFSKGEISEETYRRGVKRLEEDIERLSKGEGDSVTTTQQFRTDERMWKPVGERIADEEARQKYLEVAAPSGLWYLVPFLFGILGGIVGYVAVKDDDAEMADNLLIFGILWTVVLAVLGWLLLLR